MMPDLLGRIAPLIGASINVKAIVLLMAHASIERASVTPVGRDSIAMTSGSHHTAFAQ